MPVHNRQCFRNWLARAFNLPQKFQFPHFSLLLCLSSPRPLQGCNGICLTVKTPATPRPYQSLILFPLISSCNNNPKTLHVPPLFSVKVLPCLFFPSLPMCMDFQLFQDTPHFLTLTSFPPYLHVDAAPFVLDDPLI